VFSEIATLIAWGWGCRGVSTFKDRRATGPSRHPFRSDGRDHSFHNNMGEVDSWLEDLILKNNSVDLKQILLIIRRMIAVDVEKRPDTRNLCQEFSKALPAQALQSCGCFHGGGDSSVPDLR
jgi:hypothetical protein